MNTQDCLNMLRQMRDVAFATVDSQGNPQNRIIDIMLVEEEALYFCTARGKRFYQELMENGRVAITGLNKDWQMVRLTGKAKRLEEQKKWIDRIFEENPSMNEVYPGDARYILEPFRISAGQLEFFDLGKSPIHRASFSFGGETAVEKGFLITERCISCGKCAQGCPQKCVCAGTPYEIQQEHCLHCGRCMENCPVKAIIRRESHVV